MWWYVVWVCIGICMYENVWVWWYVCGDRWRMMCMRAVGCMVVWQVVCDVWGRRVMWVVVCDVVMIGRSV